ncbi:DUF2946 family protein [Methylobacterium durans]|uniref:DUF2946 family protein n=1 Tax=Methylobacterium durans TaxID=2202825 RepID=UPI002AFE3C06|nr:DUF2946 family protein [Methylobacterium durans]MEA1833445.1 DUF2946 family protein [Methylobacterium durans]
MIALYALLLQAFLGGLAPLAPVLSGDVICAHDGTGAPGDGGPACHQHACCTLAQAMHGLPAVSDFATVLWSPASVAPAPWRAAGPIRARAPPDPSVGPRGPPAA